MTTYAILITIAFIAITTIARAQFQRRTAQAALIIELEKRVQLLQTADKLATERADTLALGLKQAHAWLSLYREQVAELEDENRMLYRLLRRKELLGILTYPRVDVQGSVGEKREIGLN